MNATLMWFQSWDCWGILNCGQTTLCYRKINCYSTFWKWNLSQMHDIDINFVFIFGMAISVVKSLYFQLHDWFYWYLETSSLFKFNTLISLNHQNSSFAKKIQFVYNGLASVHFFYLAPYFCFRITVGFLQKYFFF